MNTKKLKSFGAAVVTLLVVWIIAVQAMYYLLHYPPTTSMWQHQFLTVIAFLFGVVAASYVYTHLQGEDKSSWLDDEKNEKEY